MFKSNLPKDKSGKIKKSMGRPKGSKDKLPQDLKKRVLAVWEQLEKQKKGLGVVAKENPKWFFENFLKPMLPKDVKMDVEGGLTVVIKRFTPDARAKSTKR